MRARLAFLVPAAVLATLALITLPACGGSSVEVLECEGTCTCEQETRTCSCAGGTDCVVEGADDITLTCDGNARCDLWCGAGCVVECPGTSGCEASMGHDSAAVCNGTGNCDYECRGDCSVDCPGTSRCSVTCADGHDCEITSCSSVEDCGDGVLVCRGSCPDGEG
jgi:hypothetical protein